MSSTIFFFLFIPLLAFILLAVNLIFAPHNPYTEKNSAFECGYSSFLGQNRTQFSISFFIFALLFLLFDLEILLVYPYLVSAYTNGVYGLAIMLMFLLALTLGFAFELGKKALYIDSRQVSKVATKKASKSSVLGNRLIYALGARSYSSGNLPMSYKDKPDLFYTMFLPSKAKSIILTKRQALKYQLLKRKLMKAFGSYTDGQMNIRICFGVLNLTSVHSLSSSGLDVISMRAFFNSFFFNVKTIPLKFNAQGIELRICPAGIKKLHDMLVSELKDEKRDIYIVISFALVQDTFILEMENHLKD